MFARRARPRDVARALPEVDFVFHMAAAVGADTDARRYLDVNAEGRRSCTTRRERELPREGKVVVASSLGVYGEGNLPLRE